MDSIEEMRNETKEYPFSRFISDVGGSLGLFMGISAATMVGIFELFIISVGKMFCKQKKSKAKDKNGGYFLFSYDYGNDKDFKYQF